MSKTNTLKALALVCLLGAGAADNAPAATGDLTQKPGTAGCISESGSDGECGDGMALDAAVSVTVSPDGKSAYVASAFYAAVAVFDRAPDGTLTQKPGAAGCVSEFSNGPCAGARTLGVPLSVTVSPDGASVYVASQARNAVAVFDRAPEGTLTQKPGAAAASRSPVVPAPVRVRAAGGF